MIFTQQPMHEKRHARVSCVHVLIESFLKDPIWFDFLTTLEVDETTIFHLSHWQIE